MDIEEGLEVIWNEVKFSESKDYRAQEKQMSSALDSMISITHPNIVKVKIPKRRRISQTISLRDIGHLYYRWPI